MGEVEDAQVGVGHLRAFDGLDAVAGVIVEIELGVSGRQAKDGDQDADEPLVADEAFRVLEQRGYRLGAGEDEERVVCVVHAHGGVCAVPGPNSVRAVNSRMRRYSYMARPKKPLSSISDWGRWRTNGIAYGRVGGERRSCGLTRAVKCPLIEVTV